MQIQGVTISFIHAAAGGDAVILEVGAATPVGVVLHATAAQLLTGKYKEFKRAWMWPPHFLPWNFYMKRGSQASDNSAPTFGALKHANAYISYTQNTDGQAMVSQSFPLDVQ